MKRFLLLAAGLALNTGGMAQSSSNRIELQPAIELDYATQTNQLYQLQCSSNLVDWTNVGQPEYGSGRRHRHLSSTQPSAGSFYRVVIVGATNTNALAPWSFTGLAVQTDDGLNPDRLDFLTDTTGNEVHPPDIDPFAYIFTKLGDNVTRVELEFSNGQSNHYTFSFTTTNRGTYVRDEFDRGRFKDRDTGIFRILAGGTNAPAGTNVTQPPAPPASLTNRVYYFHDSESPDRAEFLTATTGILVDGNPRPGDNHPTNAFTYAYNVLTPNTASLVLNFGYYGVGSNRVHQYDLTFTDGPAGIFVRREIREGVLRDIDTGAFSPYAVLPLPGGSTNPPPVGTNTPPALTNVPPIALTGENYTASTGERLAFLTANTGLQTDDSDPNPFTYTYTAAPPAGASFVITLDAGKWDEYTLAFTTATTGSFVRREFRSGVLNDTDTGTFVRAAGP